MTIRRILVASVFLCAAVACAAFAASPARAGDTIRVGAIFSATGPASFLGEPEKNTVQMAVERINEQGGVLGKKLEVVIYDDETDVNKCVLALDKLARMEHVVAVLGPTVSGNTLAVAPKISRYHIPMISCASSEKIVTPVNPWVFKVAPSDRYAALRILEHIKAAGGGKVAILTVSNGYGQSGRAVLKEQVPTVGLELVADEIYGPTDTDMTAQLTKIKGASPDAIVCWGTNPGPAVVARNRVQLGIATPLYMSHGVASKKFIELAGTAAEGILLPAGRLIVADQVAADHPQKPVVTTYRDLYEKRFGSAVSTFGGHGWDAVYLLAKAIEQAGSDDPKAIRDALEKVTGLVGTAGTFNMSAKDHNGLDQSAFVMIRIENGDWKIIGD
ncbi:MAG: ABC transporter substrate-binding protein [Desulfovibrionaceae bacterium]|jgi:branched-chain amino acid transport system substrate-binding protein|nr:ABC transporter substrate-binding protein [Desulfovibrionaceae bacterium]